MSEIKKIKSGEIELICTIDGDKWKEANKKAHNKLAKNLDIKGFRKGQAPESMVKKFLPDERVQYEAAEELAQDTLIEGIKENDVELIDRPELKIDEINNDKVVFKFTCPVKPDVELGDYKNLGYKVEDVSVTDGDVNAELDKLKEQKAELEIKEDGELENGDIAVMDYEGFKDGVAFDGGKGENYELEIGSKQFIPGFEDAMIGMKPGEEKDLDITFPEDYHAEDLKGKAVVFKVKLHEIKKKVLAVIDDELVKDLKIENVNTVDELKNYIKESLLNKKKQEVENKALEEAMSKLIDTSKMDIPQVMITNEEEDMFKEYSNRFLQQGITMDQFFKITGQKKEDILKTFEEEAIKRIKTTLCLEEIARKENIEVTEDDVNKSFEDMAKQYGMKVEDIKNYVPVDSVKSDLKLQKAIEFIKK